MKQGEQPIPTRLPPELTSRLNLMIRRVRRIIVVRGTLATLAVMLACALGIMAVDAVVLISSDAVRWGLSFGGLALTLATAWIMLVRPLRQPLTPIRIARVLETRHPELQERISSAIELLAVGGSAAQQGSEQLIQLLAHDAQADMAGVQPRHEFAGRTIKPFLLAAAATVGVLLVLFVAWPRQTVLLFARAMAPYAQIDNLQGSTLEVEPGDAVRLQGEELCIRLTVRGGGNLRAEVRSVGDKGREAVERMRRVSLPDAVDSVYELTFPAVIESFKYRVRYGAGLTHSYTVRVMPPPSISRCMIAYQYPPYTGLPATQMVANVREIAALDGTRVQIDADFDRPVDGVLLLGSRKLPGSRKKTPGAFWGLTLNTNMAPRWALALRDSYGFTNRIEWAPLRVERDLAPTVALTYPPAARFVLPPHGRIEFTYTLADDYGLGPVRLVVRAEGEKKDEALREVVLQPAGRNAWTVRYELDLARLNMDGVKQFKVWLRVADSRPPEFGGPNVANSRVVTIALDEQGRSLNEQVRKEQRATLTAMLKEAAERLTDAANGMAGVKGRLSVDVLPPETVQPVTLAQQRAVAGEDLVTRAAAMAAQSFFASLAGQMEQTVQSEIAPARACTEEVLLCQPAVRPAKGDEAERELRDAAAKTLELIKAIDALDAKADEAAALSNMADREKTLAEQAAERKLTPEEAEAWKKRQEELARQLEQAPKSTDAQMAEQAKQALQNMADAVKAMQAETPANTPEQQAARQAEKAAEQAQQAAQNALEAGQFAEQHAENRSAAQLAQDAAKQAEDAAKLAGEAAEQAKQAAAAQKTEQTVEQAAQRKDAADDALKAAQQAEQAAKQAEQAGQQAEQATQKQQQGQPQQAAEQAKEADKQGQQANQTARQAQAAAQEAQHEAQQEQAPRAEKAAEQAQAAAELGGRAAELAQQAAQMAADAQKLPQDQQAAQTQQAADKAKQAQEMAREAAQQAQAAQKLAQEEAAAAQQAAQQAAPKPAQIEQQAQQAAQAAQKASQAAQQAVQAAQQAGQAATESPVMKEAAQQAEQAAEKADQAAGLAQQAGERVDRSEKADLPEARAADENRQATQEAEMAAELAREAAEQARRAAQLAQQELANLAAEALQNAELATQQAQEAAQTAQQAAAQAQQAQSPATAETATQAQQAAQTAQQAAQLAQQSVQTAKQNSAPSDAQAVQQAQQAQALAQQALKQAGQAAQAAQAAQQPGQAQQQAAAQAAQAAQQMQQMAGKQAQQAGQQPGQPPQQWSTDEKPSQPSENRQDTMNLGTREFMPLFLKGMGFPEAEWARFKGRVDAQTLEGLLKNVPPEYRELVRRYFLELAREGQQGVAKP